MQRDREAEAIARATDRIAQRQARHLMREMRVAVREKAKARRVSRQRLLVLGTAVVSSGCGEWQPDEVTGALMDVLDRIGSSTTMRLGFRKMALSRFRRSHREPSEPAPEGNAGRGGWEDAPKDGST
jgi:hypothetical protein